MFPASDFNPFRCQKAPPPNSLPASKRQNLKTQAPPTCYAVRSLTNGKKLPRKNARMHNLVLNVPPGLFIDHINRNGLDNRKANLRPATFAQNVWNRRKFKPYSRSSYKGVDWVQKQKKWRARIRVNGKRIYLGSFKTETAAAKAYDSAAKKYHGRFAALNFPHYFKMFRPELIIFLILKT